MRFITAIRAAVRNSLKLKLTLFIVVILGLTLGIAPWGAIKMQERQLMDAAAARLRGMHEMMRKAVVDTCVLTRDREAVQRVLEAAAGHQDISALRIFDTRGVIIQSARRDERGRRVSAEEMARYVGQSDPVVVERGGSVAYTLVEPMFNQPTCSSCHPAAHKVLGILQVSLNLDSVRHQLAHLRHTAAVATLLTLGVIVVGLWISLTFLVDQPLQRLVEVMERTEHGDFTARADTRQTDEFGQLARRFNDMLSKLHAAQTELERYHHEQLARADRLATIGEMAAAIAHEIRNPLTGISGALSVLARDFPGDDPRRDIVRQTQQLIGRLNKSVESILHYSRPTEPLFQRVGLGEIIDRTLSLVAGEAGKARINLVRQDPPLDGDAIEPPTVNADPHQLQQVFMNLVLNAIQATPAGGEIQIRTQVIETTGKESIVHLEIEDTGKGMTPEDAARAFQPFFSTKAQGTGLGLAIAKQIVEQHQGRISLRSLPGQGTCVTIELPAYQPTNHEGA